MFGPSGPGSLPLGCLVLVLLASGCASSTPEREPDAGALEIRWPPEPADGAPLELRGLDRAELARLGAAADLNRAGASTLALFVEGFEDPPPVAGRYALVGEALHFVPRFGWTTNLDYRARARAGEHTLARRHRFDAPEPSPTTRLTAVYPSGELWPANLLRVYLHFSAPMRRGEAYEHVHLLDADGHALPEPFLPLPQELWNPEGTRLTLLFDPGRVKRGLVPHREQGSPLRPNASYTLVVDADWRDARGAPLAEGTRRSVRTGAADRRSPDVARWELELPAAGTRDELVVRTPDPLDRALLERLLGVRAPDGRPVAGTCRVDEGETRWRFRPREAWTAGEHVLEAAPQLEDACGNSLARPFEVDLRESAAVPEPAATTYERRFTLEG